MLSPCDGPGVAGDTCILQRRPATGPGYRVETMATRDAGQPGLHVTAVVPVAGLGTRMGPISRAVPKALLPLVDGAGRLRPVLHWILAEAVAGGCRRGVVVLSPDQRPLVRAWLDAALAQDRQGLPAEIELIEQAEPNGFGHAVLQARPAVGEGPMLLLLGDHVRLPESGQPPCTRQVIDAFGRCGGVAMVGMQTVGADELSKVGVARGEPVEGDPRVYRATALAEKPDPARARDELATPGLPAGTFLAHSGVYLFGPELMDCLAGLTPNAATGELELADAQLALLSEHPDEYYLYRQAGETYDTGSPLAYARAQQAFYTGSA